MRRASQFCLGHWGRVVRTEGFKSLSRQNLIELCEVVDTEGRIVGGPELELAGGLGADGLGPVRDSKRSQLTLGGTGADDLDDLDGDDIDGMEIS